jgi:SulP family sulfate permease
MKAKISAMIPIGYALKDSLRKGYSLQRFKHDAIAGLIVSLVALPLNMALSIAMGLPPQHGLYTAIVAGIIVPLLGGCIMQVSGPTAAFVVIVAPIVATHGLRGLIITTILAGILLIFLGIAKLGRYINYVPYPVTTGFTSGIAVVIGTLALNDLLGLDIKSGHGEYIHKVALIVQHIPALDWAEALVGIVSLVIMFTSKRILPKVPTQVIGIGMGTLLAFALQQYGFEIATIGNRFSYALPDGGTGHGIPPFPPTFYIPGLDRSHLFALPLFHEIYPLMLPALVIAVLGALESLLSASVADGMARTKHHPNSELVGIGIGNILSGLVAGVPATGAIARTATNIHSGAKTPIASSLHGMLLMIYVLLLAPILFYIPMASLAALLIIVAYHMSHYKQFIRTIQIAPKSDSIVLLTCFGFTVFIDMIAGVTAGVVLACFLLLKRVANLTQSNVSHSSTGHQHKLQHLKLPDDVMVYHINGSLFFGTAEKALDRTNFVLDSIKTLIIDLEDVPLIDMTGLVAMKTMILDMQAKDREIILCGDPQVTEKILHKLPLSASHRIKVTETMDQAVAAITDTSGLELTTK